METVSQSPPNWVQWWRRENDQEQYIDDEVEDLTGSTFDEIEG